MSSAVWQPSLLDGGAPWIEAGSLERATRTKLGEDAWVDVVPGWLHGADDLFEAVLAAAPWEAHELPMYGQLMPSPRLSARWAAGPHDPALPPVIGDAATQLSERYGHEFASVGANLYRDGSDSVAWHGDRVLRTKPEAVVAVLSLGATRRFRLRPRGGGTSIAFEPGARRPHRHGRLVPAHVAALGAEDGAAGRAPHQRLVPPRRSDRRPVARTLRA